MLRKLIALDIDGTLVGPTNRVSPRTIEAVQRLSRLGATFTIATGRRLRATLPIARELGISVPIILFNGSLVVDPQSLETLYQETLPHSLATRSIEIIHQEAETAFAYHQSLSPPDVFYQRASELPFIKAYIERGEAEGGYIRRVPDLINACASLSIIRILSWGQGEDILRVAERLRTQLVDEALVLADDYRDTVLVEVYPRGVSKGKAIAQLAASFGIDQADVIAIGDGINDVEMLEYAGLGVAMGNACPEAKQVANRVTARQEEDGVALFLEELLKGVAAS